MIGPYVLPDEVFDALAAGEGGRPAVLLLRRARRSRNLLLLRRALDGPCGGAAEAAAGLLAGVERVAPEAARSVIDGPAFGTWAARTLRDCPAHGRGGCAGRDFAALTVLAAVRAAHPARITVPVREGRLALPGLGTVTGLGEAPEALVVVETTAGPEGSPDPSAGNCRVRVLTAAGERVLPRDPSRPGHGWQPVAVLDARHRGLTLRLPLETAAPELPALDTASAGPAAWRELLRQAWELLVENHPRRAEELAAGLNGIVPLPAPARGVASATSRHAFGTVLTSWPADPERLALTLLHEFQHSKLSALTDLVTLYEPGGRPRLYAPWRPDPRPPGGLLQGIYAHLGDLAFWQDRSGRRHGPARADAAWRLAQTRAHVERGLTEAAAHVRLTDLGARFLERLARTVRDAEGDGGGSGGARLARAVARVQAGDEAVWRLRWAAADDAGTDRLAALWQSGRPAGPLPARDVRAATGAVAGPGPEFGRWAARQRGAERARPAREAADAVLAAPHRARGWAELAAAAAEEGRPGADLLRTRTELVRDLLLRLTPHQAATPPDTTSPRRPDPLALAAWLADTAADTDPAGAGPATDEQGAAGGTSQARPTHPARDLGRLGRGEPAESDPGPEPLVGDGFTIPAESGSGGVSEGSARSTGSWPGAPRAEDAAESGPGPEPGSVAEPVASVEPGPGEGRAAGAQRGDGGGPGQNTGVSMSQNARSPLAKTSATG
ncbi:aKG-HExxH-type peptide beta-hydroxylase [Streptomyces sp. SAI-097]